MPTPAPRSAPTDMDGTSDWSGGGDGGGAAHALRHRPRHNPAGAATRPLTPSQPPRSLHRGICYREFVHKCGRTGLVILFYVQHTRAHAHAQLLFAYVIAMSLCNRYARSFLSLFYLFSLSLISTHLSVHQPILVSLLKRCSLQRVHRRRQMRRGRTRIAPGGTAARLHPAATGAGPRGAATGA